MDLNFTVEVGVSINFTVEVGVSIKRRHSKVEKEKLIEDLKGTLKDVIDGRLSDFPIPNHLKLIEGFDWDAQVYEI